MSWSVIYMRSQEGYLNKYTSYSTTLLAPSCNCTNSYSMAMFMIMWLSVDCVHDPSVHTQSLKALCHYIYMWRSMTKPTTLGTMSFWVKATITKYNLWSADHANLKSLAPVGSEIWARMYLDCLYYNFTASIMKHCHCMFLNWFKTTKSYHRQLVWFISHTESQHNMVGFAMDGHIRRNYFLMSSLKWEQQVYNYTMGTANIMVESTDWSIRRLNAKTLSTVWDCQLDNSTKFIFSD